LTTIYTRNEGWIVAFQKCPDCGCDLPPDSPQGICPKCLLRLGLADSTGNAWEGKQVSRFKIIRRVGKGGMGEVYLAEDTSLGRQVALKFLPGSLQNDETARKRFVREAKSAAALDHPFICAIHEVDQTSEGEDFIVMEYVEGQTLSQRLVEGPLSREELLQIICDVSEALEEAHDKGIVHRDIKPSNIMLTRKGRAKVMDFGLAKAVLREDKTEPDLTADLTREGTAVGTVAYMSPEQILGKTSDHRSDLFSFGVVIYEIAARRHPFKSDTAGGTVNAILNASVEPLNEADPEIPRSLQRITEKLLAKDPDDRFQLTDELVQNLKGLLSSPGLRPVRSGRAENRWQFVAISSLSLLLLILAAVVLPDLWRSDPEIESLAVLPLANHSGDPDQEYLSEGITNALIQELGQIGDLRVVSRTSVMRFKESSASLEEIAKELDVDAILEGETTPGEGRIKISVRLIDADSDEIIWGEAFESEYSEILKLQSEVASEIASKIRVELTSDAQNRLASRRSVDPAAHEAYLRGRFFWSKRSREGLETAVEYFRSAIAIDPGCALAYAGLADAYAILGDSRLPEYPRREMMEEIRVAARTALELDDSVSEAHTALANVLYAYDWDFEGAEKEFRKALEINPHNATARHWYGLLLASRGRLDESLNQIQNSQQLDPVSPVNNAGLGRCFYYRREYDSAEKFYERAIELDPAFEPAHLGLGLVLIQQGDLERAIEEFNFALLNLKNRTSVLKALEHAAGGETAEAEMRLQALIQKSDEAPIPFEYLAAISSVADMTDDAFLWLEKAFEERSEVLLYLDVDPIFDNLREDERYEVLLDRVNSSS
jgi:serine/threonine-protein kinase